MRSLRAYAEIVALSVGASCFYGIVHDMITTRISLPYFTVAHPPIFGGTQDPTLLALGWGVIATWWVGLPLGILLAVSAQFGAWPKRTARDLLRPLAALLATMACLACAAGFCAAIAGIDQSDDVRRFQIDLASHTMSYFAGGVGGLVLCALTLRRRRRLCLPAEQILAG